MAVFGPEGDLPDPSAWTTLHFSVRASAMGCPRCLAVDRSETYYMESKQGIYLNPTMEIAKDDGDEVEWEVPGMATPETNKLDCLGEEEHPNQFDNQGVLAGFRVPTGRAPPQG